MTTITQDRRLDAFLAMKLEDKSMSEILDGLTANTELANRELDDWIAEPNRDIGVKFDEDKPDYSLIPPNALEEVVKALTYGAKKYDRDNWKKVKYALPRYFAAAQRHIWQIQKGEKFDSETGIHHMAHAICCLMFFIELDQ